MTLVCGLDFETTGFLDTGDHRIVEVYAGLWDLDSRALVEEFYRKVHPGRSIPVEATRVHGITLADLAGCPTFAMIADDLHAFHSRAVAMVAHNGLAFDGPFLDQEYARLGSRRHGLPIIDTMTGARWATHNGKSPTLGELCFATGVDYDPEKAHAAAYDVDRMMACFFRGLDWGLYAVDVEALRVAA